MEQTLSRTYSLQAQTVVTTGHPYRMIGRGSDVGGPFASTKMQCGPLPSPVTTSGGFPGSYDSWKSTGVLVPVALEQGLRYGRWPTPASLKAAGPGENSYNAAIAKGTTAISRVAPTSPVFDGATAVAELYSGVPSIPLRGKQGTLGSEYLNYEFAIAPTVSDIKSLHSAAERSEKIIAQLERDSGRMVRRKYSYPEEILGTTPQSTASGYPVFMGGGQPTAYEARPGTSAQSSTTTRSYQFSGAFTYYLPPKGTWSRGLAELDAVYGVKPGIDTAWNAVPFSWLADWYGNTGDVLKNITMFAQDGLVMVYGYISCLTTVSYHHTWNYPVSFPGGGGQFVPYSGSVSVHVSELNRWPATPFGFGLNTESFTSRQWAILAALGHSAL